MVTTFQKVIFPNAMQSIQHVSIFKFAILSTFTKMVNLIRQHN